MRTTPNRWRQEVTATRLAAQQAIQIRQIANGLRRSWSARNTPTTHAPQQSTEPTNS
jgi:hypothetical protein